MNANELKYLWAAPENGLSAERARRFAAAAVAQVNRERRRRRWLLIYVSTMVVLTTVLAAWVWIRKGVGTSEVWPATLILAAQWATAGYLWRIFGQGPAAVAPQEPIRTTLETLRLKAHARCRELQAVLGLFLVATPLTSIAIGQLQQTGKMRPHEAASASVLFVAILVVGGGAILFNLFARKLPEKRHLDALLREYC